MLMLQNPQVVFFMEPKLNSRLMEKVRRSCGYHYGVEVDAVGSKGGLCLAWHETIDITLQSYSI